MGRNTKSQVAADAVKRNRAVPAGPLADNYEALRAGMMTDAEFIEQEKARHSAMQREVKQLEGACRALINAMQRDRLRALQVADENVRLMQQLLDRPDVADGQQAQLQQDMQEMEALAEHLRQAPEEAAAAAVDIAVGRGDAPRRRRRARAPRRAGEAPPAAAADADP